jgi:hypothetical protein
VSFRFALLGVSVSWPRGSALTDGILSSPVVQSAILRSLSLNPTLKTCGLQNCGFSTMGSGIMFDAQHPHGTYRLDLKDPRARQVRLNPPRRGRVEAEWFACGAPG